MRRVLAQFLWLFLLPLCLGRIIFPYIGRNENAPIEMRSAPLNAEASFARGERIKLSAAEIPDLELVPSLGPKLAEILYNNKVAVRSSAVHLPERESCLAYETLPGVGPKKRRDICAYLLPR